MGSLSGACAIDRSRATSFGVMDPWVLVVEVADSVATCTLVSVLIPVFSGLCDKTAPARQTRTKDSTYVMQVLPACGLTQSAGFPAMCITYVLSASGAFTRYCDCANTAVDPGCYLEQTA